RAAARRGRRDRAVSPFSPPGAPGATPDEEYAHWLESGLVAAALERYDRVAATPGIEAPHTLLYVAVVSFSLGGPWDAPANEVLPKAILRRAMASALPAEVRESRAQPNL